MSNLLYGTWMSPSECMAEIERVRPGSHLGQELTSAAMMAGFRMRAGLAVFAAPDGSGKIVERLPDFEITNDWSHPTFAEGDDRGLLWIDVEKAEAKLIPPRPSPRQEVMLYRIAYHRDDLANHFGLDLCTPAAGRPPRGFRESDLNLVKLMREWIERSGRGVPAAAMEFASQARGHGTLESKAKRLERVYVGEVKG